MPWAGLTVYDEGSYRCVDTRLVATADERRSDDGTVAPRKENWGRVRDIEWRWVGMFGESLSLLEWKALYAQARRGWAISEMRVRGLNRPRW